MKFNSHGTYISPNSVVEIATIPAVLLRATNCRMHNPSTNRMRKLVSKSLTRAGELWMPSLPVRFRKVPTISSTPPAIPEYLKHTSSRFCDHAVKFRQPRRGQHHHDDQKHRSPKASL